MGLPTHTHKMLKCHFTQEEMTEFRDKLANSIMDLSSIEDEKKSVMSDYTARINEKKAMINRVASNIRNGYEHREVKCLIHYDFTRRVKTFFRDDTGEQVQEEVITPDECQVEIPGLEPIGDVEADQITQDVTCPHCGQESVKYPRDSKPYCEDCGWPEENDPEHVEDEPITSDPSNLPEPPCGGDVPSLTNGWVRKVNDDFIAQMNAAKTANEGRNILQAYEDRLNQLQRAAGVEPVVGDLRDVGEGGLVGRGFSTLSKKEINAICKTVSKADPGIGMIHTAIVEQWPAIQKRWDELLIVEREQKETEN